MAVRNPGLYKSLKGIFKEVRIANEGEPLVIKKRQSITGKPKLWKEAGGEEYRVCCPFCNDRRFRLYINHAWGLDATAKYPSSKLVVCHNEHCEQNKDDSENPLKYLQRKLRPYFSDIKRGLIPTIAAPTEEEINAAADPLMFPKPEWCKQFSDLPDNHDAVKYWLQRKFDLGVLEERWKVVWAEQYPVERAGKKYNWLAGRVFIPTPDDGWQARSLESDDKIKYFSCPGWKKSRCIYNIDEARKHPFAVVVEGVTNVWRIGSPAVAIFGKSLSEAQAKRMSENFNTVALLLDPDAYTGDKLGLKALTALRRRIPNVFKVTLPEGRKDAAECTFDMVWNCIERDSRLAGVPVLRPEKSDAFFGD